MAITLTITDKEIQNLSAGTAASAWGGSDTKGSIGAEYLLTAKLAIGGTDNNGNPVTGWEGSRVYFNPAMFVDEGYSWPPGAPPLQGWAYTFPNALSGGPYQMSLINCGLLTAAETNGSCELEEVVGGMLLKYRFRLTSDLRRHITTGTPITYNPNRLRRADMVGGPFAGSVWPNLGVTVYRTPPNRSVLRSIIQIARPDSTSSRYDDNIAFQARWYGQNKAGTGPGELGGFATTELVRYGNPVTDFTLSSFADTTLTMRIPKVAGYDADLTACEHALIRTDQPGNQGGTFMQDYGQDFQAGTLTDGGTEWVFTRVITAAEVLLNKKYLLVLVVRAINTATPSIVVTNSFYSSPMTASAMPLPPEVEFTGTIQDYNADPECDNVLVTIHDRLNFRINVDKDAYNTLFAGQPWSSGFNLDLKKVRLRVYRESDGVHVGPNSWFGYTNLVQDTVYSLNPTLTDNGGSITIDWPHLRTNGYMIGQDVAVEWIIEFYYPSLDWTLQYKYTQRFNTKDYQSFLGAIESLELTDADTGQPILTLCETTRARIKATLNAAIAGDDDWNIRAVVGALDPTNPTFLLISNGTASEEEQYTSLSSPLPQRQSPYIDVLADEFGADLTESVVLDTSYIDEDEVFCVAVIAQPKYEACRFASRFPSDMEYANYGVLASDQASVEAAPKPIGERYLIKGHGGPYGPFPTTTLWERNTGNIAVVVAAGTGLEGTEWDIIEVNPGQVVQVFDPPGPDHTLYFMVLTDYYYYQGGGSGKAALKYLWRGENTTPGTIGTTSAIPTFVDNGGVQVSHQTHNPAIIQDGSTDEADQCRAIVVEYTTDPVPATATWADAPDIPRLEEAQWLIWDGNFTLNLPVGTTFYRYRWERGVHVQGVSAPTAV